MAAFVATCLVAYASVSQAQLQGGAATSFEAPVLTGGPITLPAVLYKAPDSAKGAVVLLHGSAGWDDHREGHYARALVAAGYSALAVDTYGPRSITGTVADQSKLSTRQQESDTCRVRQAEAIGGGEGVPGDAPCRRGIAVVLLDAAARCAGRQDTRTGDTSRSVGARAGDRTRPGGRERLGQCEGCPDQGTFETPLVTP